MPIIESTRAVTRWTTRIIPLFLVGVISYATYVVVGRVCSSYLINKRSELGPAIAILVLYFLLLLLMIGTYIRAVIAVLVDPGIVPLGPVAIEQRKREKENRRQGIQGHDLESRPYYGGVDLDPDSPGLEQFYTKDVFICENNGRPKWCSHCYNWKPDRAHHSTEIDRCVLRMDHYCPWVGGMIGENSFKFFVQFTSYTACYCAVVLGAAASSLRKEINEGSSLDPHFIPIIVLAAFFGLFTFLMTVTSVRYIFANMTNVDMLSSRTKVHQLAVRVPRGTESTDKFTVVTYPLPKLEEVTNGRSNDTARPRAVESRGASPQPNRVSPSTRDDLATRTFAILRTEPGENPWDIGAWKNWQSVMGTNVLDWILPFRRSPCANHESHDSFYPMGKVLADVLARYNLNDLAINNGVGLEMKELRKGNRS
ncbi:zf-DHHC-domain-containing protein [Annulohypoxylon maeteangense]|uniref:zf-DHHC-domain-containing protein n=1 Tax=Annulohypoxylon maeteangense TaxID=1927788 RepID=UPI0020079CF5|nr:zf-DHHC-domain-containing protein [Annulohypoxylon maeteangense]KAI0885932.1 zf-DHHC-domain-containing protein [Annulohypoxylon maeteangense]